MSRDAYNSYLVFLALTPLWTLLIHGLEIRMSHCFRRQIPAQVGALRAIAVGFPLTGFTAWGIWLKQIPGGNPLCLAWLYGFLIYTCLSYFYFHIFNLTETARRVRILYELRREGGLTRQEIASRYSPEQMLSNRLERLLDTGQLRRVGEYYFLEGRLLYRAAKILMAWGSLLRLNPKKDSR